MNEYQDVSLLIERLAQADEQQQIVQLNEMVDSDLDEGSIALLLEAFPIEQRVRMWRSLPLEMHISVLTEMRAEARISIINALSETELRLTLAKLDNLSLIEWSDSLPDELIADAMRLISRDELELYDRAKVYDDDEIGRWVEQKVFTLPFSISVKRARGLLEKNQFETPKYVYLINRNKTFRGMVLYSDILQADGATQLKTLAQEHLVTLNARQSLSDAIDAIEHSDFPVVPVTDEHDALVGHVDWQFALSTQREIYEARLMAGTGMDEGDDLFMPVLKGTQKRGLWLGINLLTAILASVTIGLFEDVISQVVALAVLMPIVASMGGIAGSQTLTLMVRGMALNQVTIGNRLALLKNELSIGSINGIIWAVIIGGIAGLWFQSSVLGGTIALAIVVNMAIAAFFGVIIPILLDKFKLDPALAGSVILTTMTDVIGFFAFLGTASLVML
ncbi:magnesium transporter [Vibrio porteresiae]|uniref:Magnesium transporter n=1 Tax=Vibrio porteresiae DSM 19223 TaxID=1123496 RepID=A0ABZ0QL18_9VIBR|nr:magnesium transporter [Vibrio porteresiae]WPC76145.1 magnesium transporter [Vibrio porteresiae DSM 19223]